MRPLIQRAARTLIPAFLAACSGPPSVATRAAGASVEPLWSELRRVCSPHCLADELVISSSGEFAVSGGAGPARRSGRLSEEERREAAQLGNGALPEAGLVCEPFAGTEERALVVSLLEKAGGVPAVVYEERPGGKERCFGAPRKAALALADFLDRVEREYSAEEDLYDPCAGRSCGESCTLCDPRDPECVETAVLKQCSREGRCVAGFPSC